MGWWTALRGFITCCLAAKCTYHIPATCLLCDLGQGTPPWALIFFICNMELIVTPNHGVVVRIKYVNICEVPRTVPGM